MEEKDIKSVVGITLLVRKTNLARPKWNSNSPVLKKLHLSLVMLTEILTPRHHDSSMLNVYSELSHDPRW